MAQQVDPLFALNGTTLATLGAILGSLTGAIALLWRNSIEQAAQSSAQIIEAKNAEITAVNLALADARAERDLYRQLLFQRVSEEWKQQARAAVRNPNAGQGTAP